MGLLSSGCGNKYIPQIEDCPELPILELADKVDLSKAIYLGTTNVYNNDGNRTAIMEKIKSLDFSDTAIITSLRELNEFAMKNGILMTMELLIEVIEYVADLRTTIETFNNKRLSQENNSTKIKNEQ